MSTEKFFRQRLSEGGPIGKMALDFAGPDEAERAAAAERERAANLAKDELQLSKQVRSQNLGMAGSLWADLFGSGSVPADLQQAMGQGTTGYQSTGAGAGGVTLNELDPYNEDGGSGQAFTGKMNIRPGDPISDAQINAAFQEINNPGSVQISNDQDRAFIEQIRNLPPDVASQWAHASGYAGADQYYPTATGVPSGAATGTRGVRDLSGAGATGSGSGYSSGGSGVGALSQGLTTGTGSTSRQNVTGGGFRLGGAGGTTPLASRSVPKAFDPSGSLTQSGYSRGGVSSFGGTQIPGTWSQPKQTAEEAAYEQTLPGQYAGVERRTDDAVRQLSAQLAGIKNPEAAAYAGDTANKAFRSGDTLAAQRDALGKLKGYTNIQETAEERLMREVARRKMENEMKGDRDALAQNLKSRGVYGSGAEIAGNLSSMQEAANRRAIEELSAQKNAQDRAMDALGKYSDLGVSMGSQDLTEGQAANQVDQFNKNAKQQWNQYVTNTQTANNRDTAQREGTVADAKINAEKDKANHSGNIANTKVALTGIATGLNSSGANMVNGASSNLGSRFDNSADRLEANDDSEDGAFKFF